MADSDQPTRSDRAGLADLRALVWEAWQALHPSGLGDGGVPRMAVGRGFLGSRWPVPATAGTGVRPRSPGSTDPRLLQVGHTETADVRRASATRTLPWPDADSAADPEATRTGALVQLAQKGDAEAFGQLYDHYLSTIYRYVYYRVGSHALAEDLASETFLRALRSLGSFRWQGRDFGAWLVTIARNLVTDHFKSGRFRLEVATGEILDYDSASDGPEDDVVSSLTNKVLVEALKRLRNDQQECLVLRFLNGLSVAETARVLDKTEGAVKQLQLRAIRNLAKLLPDGLR